MAQLLNSRSLPYAKLMGIQAAAKAIPDRMGGKYLRREFARRLVAMQGLPMKLAQILSMSTEDATALLQKEALEKSTQVSTEEIMGRLKILHPQVWEKIVQISSKAFSASLSQVHEVLLNDGRKCALKMKHAGIEKNMDLDSSLMEFLISIFGQFKNGFSINAYKSLLVEELRSELNFVFEAARQEKLYEYFSSFAQIVIPKPYLLESGDEHILMDFEKSDPILEYSQSLPKDEKMEIASLLLEFHFNSLFKLNVIHADPNPGNFGARKRNGKIELVVYDYGSVMPLSNDLVQGFVKVLLATKNRKGVLDALLEMGFQPEPLISIEYKLLLLCDILFEPFFSEVPFEIKKWNRREKIEALLGAERWNLMIAAPPAFFFLMRAFHGIFYYANILGGEILIYPTLQKFLSKTFSINSIKNDLITNHGLAQKLRITLTKSHKTTVSLTFPCDAVNRLEEIMDPTTLQNCHNKNIDIHNIKKLAQLNNYQSMQLLELEFDQKIIKIWLE